MWIATLIISVLNGYFVYSILSFQLIFEEGFKDITHIVVFLINQFGVYGPFIAAIFTLIVFNRKKDLNGLFRQMVKLRVDLK